jgi:hypothetical protein
METTVDLKKEALKNGAIWGVISVVIFLITWYVMPNLMEGYIYPTLTFLVSIALAIFFTIDMRKKAGGYWSFSEALWKIFVMFLTAMAIIYIFNILFGKYIDPSYPVKMKELVMQKTEDMMKSIGGGMDDEALAKAMQSTKDRVDAQFTPSFSQAVVGFGISAALYFVGALIFAAIFKKNDPNPFGLEEEPVQPS